MLIGRLFLYADAFRFSALRISGATLVPFKSTDLLHGNRAVVRPVVIDLSKQQ